MEIIRSFSYQRNSTFGVIDRTAGNSCNLFDFVTALRTYTSHGGLTSARQFTSHTGSVLSICHDEKAFTTLKICVVCKVHIYLNFALI